MVLGKLVFEGWLPWIAFIVATVSYLSPVTGSIRVESTLGPIEGIAKGNSEAFIGVPYAEPPVGYWRWRNPRQKGPWASEILQATTTPPGCSQVCSDLSFACPANVSEDCLYLSIYRPSQPQKKGLLPVLVFFHGGNFRSASCSADLYDGRNVAPALDIIFVCVEYRLGAYGFLYIEEDPETGERVAGNFGIEDQLEALKFVQANINNFGGDPQKVTIAGQSAGAESIALLLNKPETADLFQQVVILSLPFALPIKSPTDSNSLGSRFASLAGCPGGNMTCLRNIPTDQIEEVTQKSMDFLVNSEKIMQLFQQWGPTVEVQMVEEFDQHLNHLKPTMIGTVSDEGILFVYDFLVDPISASDYEFVMPLLISRDTSELLRLFPANEQTNDQRSVLSNLVSVYLFSCPTQHVAKTLVDQGMDRVYHYAFDNAFSKEDAWERYTACYGKVCHGSDVPFLMHQKAVAGFTMTDEEQVFLQKYSSYLRNFIHNGDPNQEVGGNSVDDELPHWPMVGEIKDRISTLLLKSKEIQSLVTEKSEACHLFDSIGYSGIASLNKKNIDIE